MAAIKRIWREELHPRDRHGRFTSGSGDSTPSTPDITTPTPPTPADVSRMADNAIRRATGRGGVTRRRERGMPDTISTQRIPLTEGTVISVERTADGRTSIVHNGRRTELTDQSAKKFAGELDLAVDWNPGDYEDIPGVGRITKTSGGYQLDFDNGDSITLNRRESIKLLRAVEQAPASSRIETGAGPLDTFIADRNMLGFRHLGDDGRPVEVTFNKPSADKIKNAYDQLLDDIDMDINDGTRKPVYAKEISTNVGRVRIEITGPGKGDGPDDVTYIIPTEGSDWGIAITGPNSYTWYRAMGNVREELGWN